MIAAAFRVPDPEPGSFQRPSQDLSPTERGLLLRVEPGAHFGPVTALGTTADGELLVSGSLDRSVRTWNTEDLSAGDVIRPAILDDLDGTIRGLHVAPGGVQVAASSTIGGPSEYVFDADGASRYDSAARNQRALRFIDDTTLLAVRPPCAVDRVDLASGASTPVFDQGATGAWDWLSTADVAGNRLAVSCSARRPERHVLFLQLPERRLAIQIPAPASDARFSADGAWLAVGFWGNHDVWVLPVDQIQATGTLDSRKVFRLSTDTDPRQRVQSLAFQNEMLRGMRVDASGRRELFEMEHQSEGQARSLVVDDIASVAWLPDGRVAWGTRDHRLQLARIRKSSVHMLANVPSPTLGGLQGSDQPKITANGAIVALPFPARDTEVGQVPATVRTFSIEQMGFVLGETPDVSAPPTRAPGVTVKVREGCLTLGGEDLVAEGDPVCRRAEHHVTGFGTFDPALYVGGDGTLERYAPDGTRMWSVSPGGSIVRGIHPSEDGQFLVTSEADGTVRWYRPDDGTELVALFPMSTGDRWIAFTPSGYYDTSIGGEDLLGWHVNRSPEETADHFGVSRVADTFYRPDVLRGMFAARNEADAFRAASTRQVALGQIDDLVPPTATIVDAPATHSGSITLTVKAHAKAVQPLAAWKVMVDGRPVPAEKVTVAVAAAQDGSRDAWRTITVPAPERTVRVSVLPASQSLVGEPASVDVKCPGCAATRGLMAVVLDDEEEEEPIKPNLYLLSIGVSDYELDRLDLSLAARDAQDMVHTWAEQQGVFFENVETKMLTNEEATRGGIEKALGWVAEAAAPEDFTVLFLAGHGTTYDGEYFFLPTDADPESHETSMVPGKWLVDALSTVSGQTILMLDTCKSGAVLSMTGLVNTLIRPENGVVVLAASQADQLAQEDPKWGNGAFTLSAVNGMRGAADSAGRGFVTMFGLNHYISDQVRLLTNDEQTPSVAIPRTIPDFPIGVNLGLARNLQSLARGEVASRGLDEAPMCRGGELGLTVASALEDLSCGVGSFLGQSPASAFSVRGDTAAVSKWCDQFDGAACADSSNAVFTIDEERVQLAAGASPTAPATVEALVQLLAQDRSVASLVVEASTAKKAQARWRALVAAGAHPRRTSWRVGDDGYRVVQQQPGTVLYREADMAAPWKGERVAPPSFTTAALDDGLSCRGESLADDLSEALSDLSCGVQGIESQASDVQVALWSVSTQPELESWCREQSAVACVLSAAEVDQTSYLQVDLAGGAKPLPSPGRAAVRAPLYFEQGSASWNDEAMKSLKTVKRFLADRDDLLHIVIEGHTSAEGTFSFNYDLSVKRANALLKELVDAGIDPARISVRGMGEVAPVMLESNPESDRLNRRVVLHIFYAPTTSES